MSRAKNGGRIKPVRKKKLTIKQGLAIISFHDTKSIQYMHLHFLRTPEYANTSIRAC